MMILGKQKAQIGKELESQVIVLTLAQGSVFNRACLLV
jgi:hypothetical protein